MNEMGGVLKQFVEWWKLLLVVLTALFFAFKFYYNTEEMTVRMDTVEDKLGQVLKQSQENSRKLEVGFIQMQSQIERNRDDISLYIKKTLGV